MSALKDRVEIWKPTIEAAAAMLPWLTGAAFFLGVGSISLVFWWWGVSFLQVATPVDVLMASLVFAVRLMPIAVGVGLGSLSHLAPPKRRWVSYIASFACIVPFGYLTVFAPRADFAWSAMLMEGWILSIALHADRVFSKSAAMSDEDMSRFVAATKRLVITQLPIVVVGTLIAAGFDVAEHGFQGKPLYLKPQPGVDCSAELLWLGSDNAVLSCDGDRSRVIVISGHENLVFSDRR